MNKKQVEAVKTSLKETMTFKLLCIVSFSTVEKELQAKMRKKNSVAKLNLYSQLFFFSTHILSKCKLLSSGNLYICASNLFTLQQIRILLEHFHLNVFFLKVSFFVGM